MGAKTYYKNKNYESIRNSWDKETGEILGTILNYLQLLRIFIFYLIIQN